MSYQLNNMKINNDKLKLAIQKNGRLTDETLSFLWRAGLEFENYKQQLISVCRNYPIELLFVRDNDIGDYVEKGVVDLGILGQNLLLEERPKVKKLLNLRFGYCSLIVAVLKESDIFDIKDLNNKKIATSYPNSAKIYMDKNEISAEIIKINGSVEIAPSLGIADAIVDLSSSGSTLILNDLRIVEKIFDSEAVLILNNSPKTSSIKKKLVENLLQRFKSVLSAKKYKYISMDIPKNNLIKLTKLIPNVRSLQSFSSNNNDFIPVSIVINEEIFWGMLGRLKNLKVSQIKMLPLEKYIS